MKLSLREQLMITRLSFFTVTYFTIWSFYSARAYCQIAQVSLSDIIDNSSVILIGKVCKDSALFYSYVDSTTQPGVYGLGADLDGHIFVINVERILKGEALLDIINIYVKEEETLTSEGLGVSLSKKKRYLLFLNPRVMDTAIAIKYGLTLNDYYFPVLGGYGATLLEGSPALDELKKTEDYLSSQPPVPPANIPVAILLDSLTIKTRIAFDNGWLGDQKFLEEMDKKLDKAKEQLAKADSLMCFLTVQGYQKQIDFVYQKTLKKEIKGQDNQKRFVTADGWNLLYNFAQYILDRLPPGRKGVKK